jgi:hypothetical protein
MVTSLSGSTPVLFSKARRPKSADELNLLMPNFLPLSCSISLISGRVIS